MTKSELKLAIENCNDWNDEGGEFFLAVHSAIASMGTFGNPADESLSDLTLGQWQFEQAKRVLREVFRRFS